MMRNDFDRRRFLELALATGVGAFAAGCTANAVKKTVGAASSVPPAGSDIGAIDHVIFMMQENRSFDHYFGTYRGARGFDDHPEHSFGNFAQQYPGGKLNPADTLLPFHLNTATGIGECTHDLTHSWLPQHQCFNDGKMDAFVKTHTSNTYEGPVWGTLTMGYYKRSDLRYYYALADAFTLSDGYHCSVLGPTHPNRLMALSGTVDPAGLHGGPVLITDGSPTRRFSLDWPTMPEVLEDAGISWKVYSQTGAPFRATDPNILEFSDNILPYFKQYSKPKSALWKKAFTPIFPTEFRKDVQNGTLPKVTWLIPPLGYDEHPPSPPALGEWLTNEVLSILVSNPKVWAKTVLFHMYDENDGFFDHVAPPVAPLGTPGEFVTKRPLPKTALDLAGPIGLGYRVPLLVLSPFSRGGHVVSDTFDHTSQLRFLEERFGVKAPNISDWRRKTVGDLTTTLAATNPKMTVPRLPSIATATNSASPAMKKLGVTMGYDLEITENQPAYPLPEHQKMPTQERDSA